MRILCLCFFFEPDISAGSFKNSALVRELASKLPDGGTVDVVTTMPNRYSSFSVEAKDLEQIENIRIHRILLPAHKSGMIDQSFSFLNYARGVLKIVRDQNYDLVYASSSRLMMSVLGAWISRRKHIPLYLDMRDLFVDTIKDVLPGKFTALAMPLFSLLEKWAVSRASCVNVVSGGFLPYFGSRYPDTNLSVFTNGIDQEFLDSAPRHSSLLDKPVLDVLYAGNFGEGQGLHHIIPQLAKHFEGNLRFILIGAGGRLSQLRQAIEETDCRNVVIKDPIPRYALIEQYAQADILFLHLNDFDAFKKVLPSKLFEYGALGKPIWAGVSGFPAEFIKGNLSNTAVFPPCDVAAAIEVFENLEIKVTPRFEFVERYSRKRIIETMASEIISYAWTDAENLGV